MDGGMDGWRVGDWNSKSVEHIKENFFATCNILQVLYLLLYSPKSVQRQLSSL